MGRRKSDGGSLSFCFRFGINVVKEQKSNWRGRVGWGRFFFFWTFSAFFFSSFSFFSNLAIIVS